MEREKLRILVIGAHPDDPEYYAGGITQMYTRLGHTVQYVTVTNGDAGHFELYGEALAERRRAEAAAAGRRLGIEYIVLDNHDGLLLPTLDVRLEIVRILRQFRPNVVFTHRPWDYHADHRYTSQVVNDAMIPACFGHSVLPDLPMLRPIPVMMYLFDEFTRPYPFNPDIIVGIDDVVRGKVEALHCHTSQVYDSALQFSDSPPPDDEAGRIEWLWKDLDAYLRDAADRYRDRLIETYGEEIGSRIQYAEAFEYCEYGKSAMRLDAEMRDEDKQRTFPFLP